jgi:hypothetical protein
VIADHSLVEAYAKTSGEHLVICACGYLASANSPAAAVATHAAHASDPAGRQALYVAGILTPDAVRKFEVLPPQHYIVTGYTAGQTGRRRLPPIVNCNGRPMDLATAREIATLGIARSGGERIYHPEPLISRPEDVR